MISSTARGLKHGLTIVNIKVNTLMAKSREKVVMNGVMEAFMKESGLKIKLVVLGNIDGQTVEDIKVLLSIN